MGDARRRVVLVCALVPVIIAGAAVSAFSADGASAGVSGARDVRSALTASAQETRADDVPHEHDSADFQNSFVEAAHLAAEADGARATTPTLPTGFSDQKVISGMSEAVSADFAPDGTAFVALKTGQVKVSNYNSAAGTWSAVTDFADLQSNVNNYGDRGLTGIAVDPKFPTRPYVYVNYTYDKDPRDGAGGVVPKWGTGSAYDDCPTPATEANPSIAGCIVQDRVTRLTAVKSGSNWVMSGQEKELLVGGCYQFSSHASGDVAFGPDGKLYASSGEGASFLDQDYGQYASPCPGDPGNEGGSLRSQDYRTPGDALGVDGSVFRMDPDAGVVPTQANASQWLVAYGQRNPWRLAFRPKADGTGASNELWSGDVGASTAEEVNRVADVTQVGTPINRGWPCYEGNYVESAAQPAWDALNKPLCETLYTQGTSAVQKPVFSYQTRDGGPLVAGEDCANETSSVSGIAFPTALSDYPAAYKNAMFFSDFARSCIWVLGKTSDGEPDPTKIQTFVQAASTPVDLLTGPGGDLYYVDYGINPNGTVGQGIAGVHRIVYTGSNGVPTARIAANPVSGTAPLDVSFSGSTSSDPDGDVLTYRWDFDNNGTWDQLSGATATHRYATGTWTAKLEVNDGHGHTATATQQIQAGNTAPTLGSVTPAATLSWAAGDQIGYSATANDQQQGSMPSSAFSWQLEIRHCPSSICHSHPFGNFTGATGTFTAPPHEYPSHLLLTVTVTDSGGLTDSRTIQLNPKTVDLTFTSSPSGAGVTIGEVDTVMPDAETFIQKAPVTVTAAPLTGSGATVAAFSSWSDGGARSHTITPGTGNATLAATYTRPTAGLTANPPSGSAPLTVTYTASGTNAAGVTGGFTYAWDLDNDGQYDDGTGGTKTATYNASGSPVVKVLVTDSRGATDAKSVTVPVAAANRDPVAAISANPTSGPAPLAATFSAAGSSDPDGDTLSYAWDLDNDGQYDDATGSTAFRTYTGVGAKVVTVRVSDTRGGSATTSVTVTVTNSGPTARITTTPSSATGYAPFAVQFSGTTSSDPDGGALTYAWDLDADGQYDDGTAATASRTYGVGNVAVGLRVTDAHNASSTATVPVSVPNRAPVVALSANRTSGPAPLAVTFTASGSDPDGSALTYAWDLDDDGAFDDGTGATASRTFTAVGVHQVRVRVSDPHGGTDIETTTVTVGNTVPVAKLSATPAGGPAPLAVSFGSAGSSDPDGGALTYAWDLDGDGQYDDGTAATATATYDVGSVVVGLRVTDAQGDTATATTSVTASNTAPSVTRVSTYPEGGYYIGQTLGFDTDGTDAQQSLPASAYTFVMERQACASGCPRELVQQWTGTKLGQFVVPELPFASALFLTARVTDEHGATDSRTVRLDPRPTTLTVNVKGKFKVEVDGKDRKSGWTGQYVVGGTATLVAPNKQVRKGVRYVFVKWSDGGARKHDVRIWDQPLTVKAVYRRVR